VQFKVIALKYLKSLRIFDNIKNYLLARVKASSRAANGFTFFGIWKCIRRFDGEFCGLFLPLPFVLALGERVYGAIL
jgi:hypothetical protein